MCLFLLKYPPVEQENWRNKSTFPGGYTFLDHLQAKTEDLAIQSLTFHFQDQKRLVSLIKNFKIVFYGSSNCHRKIRV
jgi:hypothetical protein